MQKLSKMRTVFLLAFVGVMVAGLFALVGCAASSGSSSSASASGSTSAASSSATSSASSETPKYTVPNVISLQQADAEKAILASGLLEGAVKLENSDTVPEGCVISQDPKALTSAPAGTKVNLVVSKGKAEAKDVQVPDLKGKTKDDANKALAGVGLIGVESNPEVSTEVQPGQVFKQSVAAGTTVKEGTKIAFTVATAPADVTVPNVMSLSREEAKAAAEKAGLGFDSTVAYSDMVPKDKVAFQSLQPNSTVKAGTTLSVTISLGPAPAEEVEVPNVISYTWSDAEGALRSAGLTARYTGDPAGTVVSQDVAAGTKVAKGTLVTVSLSSPVKMVTVPDLYGMTVNGADGVLSAVNLAMEAYGDVLGTVVSQEPAAGTEVEERTTVYVTLESESLWKSASSAADAAGKAGLKDFSVVDAITVGGLDFNNPSFSYATGAVEAFYEHAACGVYVRKTDEANKILATDRNLFEFAYNWTQNIKGLTVNCYGAQKDKATVVWWNIDDMTYCVTFQGFGGEEMTMSPEDISSLANAIQ